MHRSCVCIAVNKKRKVIAGELYFLCNDCLQLQNKKAVKKPFKRKSK